MQIQTGGSVPPIEDVSERARAAVETHAGLRCVGCHRRITGKGLEFTIAKVWKSMEEIGRGELAVDRVVTCIAEDCGAALNIAPEATAVRTIDDEILFLDEPRAQTLLEGLRKIQEAGATS